MYVNVDQSRHRHASAQVDHLRSLARYGFDIGNRTDDQEFAILDRYRIGPRLRFVDGMYFAVCVDGIGGIGYGYVMGFGRWTVVG
jgi:hypothetical protein